MFPAETTLAHEGSLVNSDICPFHFRESDKSTLSVNFKNGQAFRLASCLKSKGIICFNKKFSNQCLRQNIKQGDKLWNAKFELFFLFWKLTLDQSAGSRFVLIGWKFVLKIDSHFAIRTSSFCLMYCLKQKISC